MAVQNRQDVIIPECSFDGRKGPWMSLGGLTNWTELLVFHLQQLIGGKPCNDVSELTGTACVELIFAEPWR